ncbi:phosphotransferase [Rhodococcus sp. IEGM 1341]|uniref:phosphotransferase family protein n=1 Tax=Rhodococcus sp. IEGM 1341 TaxID=3047090 RepID=UPI0024B66B1E|nr:phosphotransferase [Rhodococcus sp. IEGM 1341]MDI9927458.1 phosphotransferase [Rhodococcus sp. IEGM 1341]
MTVRQTLSELGIWAAGEVTLDPGTTMASPSWWGADSERFSARAEVADSGVGSAAYIKVMEPHARDYVDVAASFSAATAAGDAGIGPKAFVSDAASGVLIMEDFTGVCHTATLDVFDDDAEVEKLVTLRTSVHGLNGITRRASVFDDLTQARSLVEQVGGALPADFDWMLRTLGPAEARIESAGVDAVPCHGDGNVSNVLVLDDGSMRLVDWDVAALMDPLQDIGALLAEIRPFDTDAREVFEMMWGSFDSALFDRARIYGIADCVRWALIGSYADAMRPGTHEYSKFSDWQFLRARAGLRDPHFDDRVRNI